MVETLPRPNLFRFATSELSQDAFLCWLIDHARHPWHQGLHTCARSFVALLYNRANPEARLSDTDIVEVTTPARQVNDIDISFEAVIGDRRVSFIIEDKVNTSHHSGQLERYKKFLENSGIATSDLVPVYLKTGAMFHEDQDASGHGYVVVGPDDLLAFLTNHLADVDSEIFAHFVDHLGERVARRREDLAELFERGEVRAFMHDHVQWAFMEHLVAGLAYVPGTGKLHRDRNRNGSPWTQYCFSKLDDALMPDRIREDLFYRIDGRKNPDDGTWGYYLAVRQFGRVKESTDATRRHKLERLARYREAFRVAFEACPGLRCAKPTTDNQGNEESEIGTIFFGRDQNSPSDVLSAWPVFHRAFLAGLHAAGLLPDAREGQLQEAQA
jgi:hypothetical protein